MVRHEFTFLSADGKTPIHGVLWQPEGKPQAVLQIAHGVAEYILRYEPLAEYLTAQGFAVVGHDHLGHGESRLPDSAPLYFGRKDSWFDVVDDMELLRQRGKRAFPNLPYFLLGHSMGSFLSRCYLIRYPGAVDGAILMGTGQMSPVILGAGKAIAALEGWRIGEDRCSALVEKLAFGAYNKPFAPNRTAFDWLSVNEENVDRYIEDPLCGGTATTGLFREMMRGMAFMRKPKQLKKMDRSTPILFISGKMDPVGGCGKGTRQAYESFLKIGMEDVTIKLYDNLRHEILQEDCREEIFEYLYQWMTSHIPASV